VNNSRSSHHDSQQPTGRPDAACSANPPRTGSQGLTRGQWLVLTAAFLGWMFDGVELGLFPLVARPALQELLNVSGDAGVGNWNGIIAACFLLGAALGGLVFGWLGDRIGRVRAMVVSVLTYSVFTGLGCFATSAWQLGALRFIAALGMGGEWAVGVALVMECWPERYRPRLAGAIGAAANVGFLLIGVVAYFYPVTGDTWRYMMVVGASPAVLALFITFFVPESEKWKASVQTATKTPIIEIFTAGQRKRTILGIVFSAIPLIGTWAAVSGWIPLWAEQIQENESIRQRVALVRTEIETGTGQPLEDPTLRKLLNEEQDDAVKSEAARAKAGIQIIMSIGAIVACYVAPLAGGRWGRRPAYFGLCLLSLLSCAFMFRTLHTFDLTFVISGLVVGGITSAFYGWLPLYLPEIFPTRIRATGQGLCFNFGRVLAAVGAIQMGVLVQLLGGNYASAGGTITLIYGLGLILIWLAPETKGKPLPE